MGECLSWAAIRGKPASHIHRALGLAPNGAREPSLGYRGSTEVPFVGAELPGGWYIVVANGAEYFSEKILLKTLSVSCELVSCFVESHVMVSIAHGYLNGKEVWSITHDTLRKGPKHLDAKGTLPPAFFGVADTQRKKPTEAGPPHPPGTRVDPLFSVPVLLAESITGFRHDGESARREFEVLTKRARV